MSHPLFIYGTLHPDRAPAAIAPTASLLKPLGRATIQGRLYNLGDYPGEILSADAHPKRDDTRTVTGELFSIPEGLEAEAILARLDAYEDFHSANPPNSLFLRQITFAKCEDGSELDCWVYTYNRPVPEFAVQTDESR